jgi:hypothetical protein
VAGVGDGVAELVVDGLGVGVEETPSGLVVEVGELLAGLVLEVEELLAGLGVAIEELLETLVVEIEELLEALVVEIDVEDAAGVELETARLVQPFSDVTYIGLDVIAAPAASGSS